MKKYISSTYWTIILVMAFTLSMGLFTSCEEANDPRPYEGAKVVGVKINGKLYLPTSYTDQATIVQIEAGQELNPVSLQVLVANGELLNFTNPSEYDARFPFDLRIRSFNGEEITTQLRIQSPPVLKNILVEGLSVGIKEAYTTSGSIILQVPVGTNLSSQKVTLTFANGTMTNFNNGEARDYTNPVLFNVLGIDNETNYPYKLTLTTEPVGPATIKKMIINGIATDSVVIDSKNVATPYIPALLNFTNVNITLQAGLDNVIDPAAKLTGLNLLSGTNKVKITGTNTIETEFTIGVPKLSLTPVLKAPYGSFITGAEALTSCAISNNQLIFANHTTPLGPLSMNIDGTGVVALSKTGSNIDGTAVNGVRKLTADDNGVILGVQLGAGAGASTEISIWRWDTPSSNPVKYISYTQSALGLAYAPRAAGINISGSLDGNAIITVPIAQKTDLLVWTVTGGVLNPTPTKMTTPYVGNSYYYSVQPMPIGTQGFIGTFYGTFSGTTTTMIASLGNTMSENYKLTTYMSTDCDIIIFNGRTYLAYTGFDTMSGRNNIFFNVCDITDNTLAAIQNPIMNTRVSADVANANGTLDAAFGVINGKLHVLFTCTNKGAYLFKLEQ